jgi:hypothetical protein
MRSASEPMDRMGHSSMRAALIYQHRFTEAVARRLQTGVTGSRSHGYSYGGFGNDTHISTRIPMSGNVTQC